MSHIKSISAGLLLLMLVLCGCPRQDSGNSQNQAGDNHEATDAGQVSIRIGGILPLTGNFAVLGVPERQGIELAVEHANEKLNSYDSKVRLSAAFEDTAGEVKNAVAAAQKLLDDDISLIITSTTGASRAIMPLADEAGVPLVSLCLDPSIQTESDYVFRLYEGIDQEAKTILEYFQESSVPDRNVGVLYVNNAASLQQLNDYFIPGFASLGIDLTFEEGYEMSYKDFKSLAAKADAANLNDLIIIGYGFEFPGIIRDFSHLSPAPQILGGWGFVAIDSLTDQELEGVIVATPAYMLSNYEQANSFNTAYSAKYGEAPNFDAAFAYNSVMMIAAALGGAGNDVSPSRIRDGLAQMDSYEGIFGHVLLTEEGALEVPMVLATYESGNLVEFTAGSR